MLRFFREHGEDYRRAMRVCSSCLVRAQRPASRSSVAPRTGDGAAPGGGAAPVARRAGSSSAARVSCLRDTRVTQDAEKRSETVSTSQS